MNIAVPFNNAASEMNFLEIEKKFKLQNDNDWNKLINAMVDLRPLQDHYSTNRGKDFYEVEHDIAPLLFSRPVSIYYDTPDNRLHKAGISIRKRITPHNPNWVEIGIKTLGKIVNGIPIRHEEEYLGNNIDFSRFESPTSKKLLNAIDVSESEILPKFSTCVERYAAVFVVNGITVEIAADRLIYKDAKGRFLEKSYEVEFEYKGTDHTISEISRSIRILSDKLVKDYAIRLKNQAKSKGCRGYNLIK